MFALSDSSQSSTKASSSCTWSTLVRFPNPLADGSQARTLSIWVPTQPRPIEESPRLQRFPSASESILTENNSRKNGLSGKMLYTYHRLRYHILLNHFEGWNAFKRAELISSLLYRENFDVGNNVDMFLSSIFHPLAGNYSSLLAKFYYINFTINLQYWLDFTVDFIMRSYKIIGNFILVEWL